MSHSQAIIPAKAFAGQCAARSSVSLPVLARRLLPIVAIGALLAAAVAHPDAGSAVAGPVVVRDAALPGLADKAEAMRTHLLAQPHVGAVTLTGLRRMGVAVEYTPRRLAVLGLTESALATGMPVDAAQSRPGRLVLRSDDMRAVADRTVQAGGRALRLGDVALVERAPLAAPESTLRIEGEPAVVLVATATR